MVSLALVLPAGSALDPGDRPGLASLTADMLDEGSDTRSAIEMQEALARIGAELDTEAGPDSVVLSLSLLERFVPQGLRLLADIAVRPRLDPSDFDRVRTLRINRIRQLRDVPGVVADAVFLRELFGAHPYGHLTIGSGASLAEMHPGDVAGFHRLRYDPARAMLIGVGALDSAGFARDAEEAFGGWTPAAGRDAAANATRGDARTGRLDAMPGRRLLIVDRPGAAQTELRVGHLGVPRQHAQLPRPRPPQRGPGRPLLEPPQPEPPRAQGLHVRRPVCVRLQAHGGSVLGSDKRADRRDGGRHHARSWANSAASPASGRRAKTSGACRRRPSRRAIRGTSKRPARWRGAWPSSPPTDCRMTRSRCSAPPFGR